ncbi:MAG: hypothetical protein QOG65_1725, partial [Actinomycetota bacterium]|nr:hypothetical protein [Actinomycetota bacterium]
MTHALRHREFRGPVRRAARDLLTGKAATAATAMLAVAGLAACIGDTAPPTEPGPITVSAVTASAATLSFAKSTDDVGVEGYRVYRGAASAPASALSLVKTIDTASPYSAKPLFSGTAYKFGVVAIDAANNQSPMRTVTLTTKSSTDAVAPIPPTSGSVSGKVFSSSRLDIFWAGSTSTDATAYQVLRDGVVIATVTRPSANRYSDDDVTASHSYVYAIRTVDSNHNVSTATSGRRVSTPAAGTMLITRGPYLSNVTATTAVVSWWTNLATAGVVRWGTTSPTTHSVSDPSGARQH